MKIKIGTTGKIDVHYMNSLSYTGVDRLLDLYAKHPDIPRLEYILRETKRSWRNGADELWQSFHMQKHKESERLARCDES